MKAKYIVYGKGKKHKLFFHGFCEACGTEMHKPHNPKRHKVRFCSHLCANRTMFAGKHSPRWKGGEYIHDGYVLIWKPTHPQSQKGGYIHKHRYIMSEMIGRALTNSEVVHHKNGNKEDNRHVNLELMTRSTHRTLHATGSKMSEATKEKLRQAKIDNPIPRNKITGRFLRKIT